jgi:hypothetical protein
VELLNRYRETLDPALRAEMERVRIQSFFGAADDPPVR